MTALLEAPRCLYPFTAAGEHAATQDATVTTMPRWIVRSPRLVHLTVAAARPAITAQGLRPASWLVERAGGLDDGQRERLLVEPRRESVWIDVEGHRTRLRDQQPLGPGWTSRLVETEHPADYVRALNDHVFLFPSSAVGLTRLKGKYREDGQILELDTEAVLGDAIIAERTRLVDHNPGAMSFDPGTRHLDRAKWHTIKG